jgi:TPR repeat protein
MKGNWVTCALLVLVVVAIRLPAQQSEADRKQFEATKAKAEKGDAIAQFNIGYAYFNGSGVAKDEAEAAKWCRRAA